jgi:hypothetical protein
MLEFLPANSIVAEVGTLYGHFAEKILSITKPIKLHIIDINLSLFKKELVQSSFTKAIHPGSWGIFQTITLTGFTSTLIIPMKV